jgi:predicted GIY-YIG superfamily endonuclease
MDKIFSRYTDELPGLLSKLLGMDPIDPTSLPKDIPQRGIYLFTENGTPLYVGRTNNIRRRIKHHCRLSSQHNHATFAFRIARVKTVYKKATYKTAGSRKMLEQDLVFKTAFSAAKESIRKMQLRYVEVNNPVMQTLFEVYASVVLKTPYNDFENH